MLNYQRVGLHALCDIMIHHYISGRFTMAQLEVKGYMEFHFRFSASIYPLLEVNLTYVEPHPCKLQIVCWK